MALLYRPRSLTLHIRLITLLLPLFHAVPTACSLDSAARTNDFSHGLAGRDPKFRTGNFVTSSPAVNFSINKTPSYHRNVMYVVLGVVCGLLFLALVCFAAHCIIKAIQRRKVRAASHSINTRRESTDSIWGIPEEPHHEYPRDERAYDYPQTGQASLEAPTISYGHAGMSEKELNFPAWKSKDLTSPAKWNQPSPKYHEDGYTGIPPYDLEKGNNYSRESLAPTAPPKKPERPRDTTSAIIEDRFGPSVINRSETRSSYESYRKTLTPVGTRPPTTPKP